MGFSKNFSFHIQDEAQGYHWTDSSCTVHPVVGYYKNGVGKLTTSSLYFFSSELLHNTVMVYLMQCKIIPFLKNLIPELKFVEYFSDRYAAQHINRKYFCNLCLPEKELRVKAIWSFFAVSHSKSPCDGVGGTVKRFTAVKSLWHLFHYQILSVDAMMAYCSSHRTKITFFELSSKELLQQRVKLEQQFQKAVTICSFLFWQRMLWRTCRLLSLWN